MVGITVGIEHTKARILDGKAQPPHDVAAPSFREIGDAFHPARRVLHSAILGETRICAPPPSFWFDPGLPLSRVTTGGPRPRRVRGYRLPRLVRPDDTTTAGHGLAGEPQFALSRRPIGQSPLSTGIDAMGI